MQQKPKNFIFAPLTAYARRKSQSNSKKNYKKVRQGKMNGDII